QYLRQRVPEAKPAAAAVQAAQEQLTPLQPVQQVTAAPLQQVFAERGGEARQQCQGVQITEQLLVQFGEHLALHVVTQQRTPRLQALAERCFIGIEQQQANRRQPAFAE